jgi:hypothetical protein
MRCDAARLQYRAFFACPAVLPVMLRLIVSRRIVDDVPPLFEQF